MTLRRPLPALSDLLGLHVLTMGSSNPASCLDSSRRCDQVRSTGRIHRTAIDGNGDAGHRSSSHSERTTSTRRTIGPPSRTRRHTTCTGTSAWSGTRSSQRRQSLWTAAGCGSCRTPSASPPPRGRTTGLSPSPGVRLLAPVGVIAAAVDVPTAGDGPVWSPRSLDAAVQRFRILNRGAIRARRHQANAHVNADGRPRLHRRQPLASLEAATGEPRPRRPVDRNLADGSSVRRTADAPPWRPCRSSAGSQPCRPRARCPVHCLSARKPCSCLRRLNLGNPAGRPERWPALTRWR